MRKGRIRPGRRCAAAIAAALALPAPAASEEYVVDPGHTFPMFAVSHLGISTQRGRFDRTTGRIVLDRESGTGTIDIAIDASSLSTGNRQLDAVLGDEGFFDVARHPRITFRAHEIAFEDGIPRRARGELAMAGVSRPVEVRIASFGCTRLPFLVRTTCGADLVASLRRSEFGMTAYPALVGDEVRLEIQVEAVRQEPQAQDPPAGGG